MKKVLILFLITQYGLSSYIKASDSEHQASLELSEFIELPASAEDPEHQASLEQRLSELLELPAAAESPAHIKPQVVTTTTLKIDPTLVTQVVTY